MNLKIIAAGLILTLLSLTAKAQTPPENIKELETEYQHFFSNSRENVFIHLYKSKLLPGEDLWFASYLYDLKDGKPAGKSTNLDIQLFDSLGNEIISKTFYSFNGKSHGSIDIKSLQLSPGIYYIKASSKYIRTRDTTLSNSKSFEILGDAQNSNFNRNETEFDLQLFPEGGHLLSETNNIVGVKLDNPTGNKLDELPGYVIDETDTISRFTTNRFGMATFPIQIKADGNYRVSISTATGSQVEKRLPKAEPRGVAMTVKRFSDEILISLRTNAQTIDEIRDQKFYAAIHQEGKIKDFSFYFPEEQTEASIKFPEDSLFTGVNTLTIFNESFQPLLERLVYKNQQLEKEIKVTGVRNLGDSLKIRLINPATNGQITNLSIATLPSITKAYEDDSNIISKFLLEPHVKGRIKNPAYYFSQIESERRRMYDLDLLLLTQGWSRYSWEEIFKNTPPEKIIRNQGFSIRGKVFKRNLKKENELFLKNEVSGEFGIINIENDNSFKVSNLFIEDSTKFSVGILNDRNSKLSKPSVRFQVFPEVYHSSLSAEQLENLGIKPNATNIEIPDNFVSTAQVLDTVTIRGTKKINQDRKLGNRLSAMADEFIIDEDDVRSYLFITDLIARNGFNVRRTPASVEIRSRIPFSMDGLPPEPNIYLNGSRLIGDLSILYSITTDQVESVYINTSASAGRGLNSGGGLIEINLKKGSSRGNNADTINSIIANNGFAAQKQYYNPKYNSYSAKLFQEYGVIDWKPEVFIDNDFIDIKILNTLQKKIKLFIEGFTSDGKLISEIIELDTTR